MMRCLNPKKSHENRQISPSMPDKESVTEAATVVLERQVACQFCKYLLEGALLAGLTKGPNYFSPDRHRGRAQERLAYVLSRLQEDGITSEPLGRGLPTLPPMVAFERPRRDIGFHFVDQVAREAKALAGIDAITANSYTVRSTISPSRL